MEKVSFELESTASSNNSHSAVLSGRLVAELCPRFCTQLDKLTAVTWPQIWKLVGMTTISSIIALLK